MSRCAHAKSTYQIRELPTCPKCKQQMTLVMASYEKIRSPVFEWECRYCEIVLERQVEDEVTYEEEEMLHNRSKEGGRVNPQGKPSIKELMRYGFRSRTQ